MAGRRDRVRRGALPIRVVPSLVPDSDGRTLELELRWSEPPADGGTVEAPDRARDSSLRSVLERAEGRRAGRRRSPNLGRGGPPDGRRIRRRGGKRRERGCRANDATRSDDEPGRFAGSAGGAWRSRRDAAGSGRARLRLQFEKWVDPGDALRGAVDGRIPGRRFRARGDRPVRCARRAAPRERGGDPHPDGRAVRSPARRAASPRRSARSRRSTAGTPRVRTEGRSLVVPGIPPDHALVLGWRGSCARRGSSSGGSRRSRPGSAPTPSGSAGSGICPGSSGPISTCSRST